MLDTVKQLLVAQYSVVIIDYKDLEQDIIAAVAANSVAKLIASLALRIPNNAIILGWSLGGMLAIAMAAKYPQKITSIITCGTNLSFVQTVNYQTAMPYQQFASFKQLLATDRVKCMQQFRFLIAKGSNKSKEVLKYLEAIADKHLTDVYLQSSLALLQMLDVTGIWPIATAGIHIYGSGDALVPQISSQCMQAEEHEVVVMPHQGHAAFLDNPLEFLHLAKLI